MSNFKQFFAVMTANFVSEISYGLYEKYSDRKGYIFKQIALKSKTRSIIIRDRLEKEIIINDIFEKDYEHFNKQ